MSDAFHLIGVGGAGMSVVAELLLARGFQVSGSDVKDSDTLRRLEKLGVKVTSYQDRANVPEDATVVYSSAIRPDNPEKQEALARGLRLLHRSEALAYAANQQLFVAVAGAHGKTTTSAMIAQALCGCGEDPSWAVGSSILGLGSGAHLGRGGVFVAEADESDGSFLNYSPTIAVVTNVEPDHLDHYGSPERFAQAFVEFVGNLRSYQIQLDGAERTIPPTLVVCSDDPGALRLAEQVSAHCAGAEDEITLITYGQEPCDVAAGCGVGSGHILVTDIEIDSTGSGATLEILGKSEVQLRLGVAGLHNILNAVAAVAVAVSLGLPAGSAAAALGQFQGTGRRFEFRGEVGGRRLFDDYAHHPTEVRAALQQARIVAGEGQVHVLFQPHLYSRTKNFASQFAQALSLADHVALMDIFGAREDPVEGVTSELIARHAGQGFQVLRGADVAAAGAAAAEAVAPGDILVLVGAGSVTGAGTAVLQQWRLQDSQEASRR